MADPLRETGLLAFLNNPETSLPVHVTSLFDGQTGITICMKFIDRRAVSALVYLRGMDGYRIDRVRREWILPDTWKQKEVIRELLQFIEMKETRYDRENHVA